MNVRRASLLLAAFLFLHLSAAAQACEGCKSSMSEGTAAEDSGLGFAISTYTMLGMPFLLIGGIGFMAYRNIRKIDQLRAAAATDAGLTDPSASPVTT